MEVNTANIGLFSTNQTEDILYTSDKEEFLLVLFNFLVLIY